MTTTANIRIQPPHRWLVILAFATVYLVWGSTYFFIQKAIEHIPALLMAGFRFTVAGMLLMAWCRFRGARIWVAAHVQHAAVSGLLLLVIGNGAVVWVEQYLPSSLVAVMACATPVWLVLLDKPQWKTNFNSKTTLIGLLIGFAGVALLFNGRANNTGSAATGAMQLIAWIVLFFGTIGWASGSLYARYRSKGPVAVNTAWQMIAAGLVLLLLSCMSGELHGFKWQTVTPVSWLSLWYLIVLGSLAGYSAYVWLLQVRSATQVSTHAYINPVVAVSLGILFNQERLSLLQLAGLGVILTSVLLINLSKYRK